MIYSGANHWRDVSSTTAFGEQGTPVGRPAATDAPVDESVRVLETARGFEEIAEATDQDTASNRS